jgi:hypothetical protein
MSLLESVAVATPEIAVIGVETVYGPCRGPQAPSAAGTSPENGGCGTMAFCSPAKLWTRFCRSKTRPVRPSTTCLNMVSPPLLMNSVS